MEGDGCGGLLGSGCRVLSVNHWNTAALGDAAMLPVTAFVHPHNIARLPSPFDEPAPTDRPAPTTAARDRR